MKALVLTQPRALSLLDRPVPEIEQPSDVIIRVSQTGICGTDRSVLVGKFPASCGVILGHEAVGTVETVGPAVTTLKPGDRVIANPTLYCGVCASCMRGHWNFCLNKAGTEVGLDLDGAFAEYLRLPERFYHLVPEEMSFDRAVGVEPLACALNNIDAGGLVAGETAIIIGGGPIGTVCAMAARHYGARVLVVEPDPVRQRLCEEILAGAGAEALVSVHAPDDPSLVQRADLVIDTVGCLLEQAVTYAALRGRVVVMGYNSNASATVRPLELLQRGLRIIGAGDYNGSGFPRAIELARSLPLERLISHRFPLEDFEAAFKALSTNPGEAYTAMKVVLVPLPERAAA